MSDYGSVISTLRQLDRDSLLRVSGFVDALLQEDKVLPAATAAVDQPPVAIIFASQSGNAEQVAEAFDAQFQADGRATTVLNIAEVNIRKLPDYSFVVIVASTHGEGDPPDTAVGFYEKLISRRAPRLDAVRYAVVALGDRSYDQFCAFGQWIDHRFEELGAQRLQPRLDCDVDYEQRTSTWLLDLKKKENAVDGGLRAAAPPSVAASSAAHPWRTEVIEVVDLCMAAADKSVYHLELESPGNTLPYSPGDSLGVVVLNPEEVVEQLLEHSGLEAEAPVHFAAKDLSLHECLSRHAELFRLTRKQLLTFLDSFPNSEISDALTSPEKASAFIFTHDWLDILQHYPRARMTDAQSFVNVLNPQGRRLYSISSSPIAHPDEIHLTVRLRRFGEKQRHGLISGHVAALEQGDHVSVYLKPNKNFRLPDNDQTPLLMIGAGTGVAPYRAFLYHLLEQVARPPAWLFMGEQYFRHSFLYQADWLKLLKAGVLTRLTPAFSRDGGDKTYVQDKLLQEAKQVFEWIEQGAVVYLCGSADAMAADVNRVLMQIISEQGGVDEEAAQQRLQDMLTQGQYKRDVY